MVFILATLWTLFIYSLCRIQFLLWNWGYFKTQGLKDIFQAFFFALRFDLSAIAILSFVPFLIFGLIQFLKPDLRDRLLRFVFVPVFVMFHLPTMIFNLGDAEFIHFLGRRYTFDALFFLAEIPGKFLDLFLTYWKLNLIDISIITIFVIGLTKLINAYRENRSSLKRRGSVLAILFIALLVASRGGLQNKPINFAHAQIYKQPMMNSLVLNSSFTMIQTVKRAALPREQFFDQTEMLKWITLGRSAEHSIESAKDIKPNIVLIILESFSVEFLSHSGAPGYTPFLDELAGKGIYFSNAYANARRSIEGIGAIMGGIPALMNEPFISSQYLTNHFLGLGTELGSLGYQTSFFHGAKNGSMYFDQFLRSAGVQNYFGKNEYPNQADDDGTWGIWDEPFLLWMSEKLNTFKQPFFSAVFTLSSHHPYRIPEQYKDQFPKGESEIHASVGYTDYALRKFFERAEKQAWYRNTVFIITADHTYKPVRPEFDNELGNYQIPIIIYSPEHKLAKLAMDPKKDLIQQIDLFPTMLDIAGHKQQESNLLGLSIFALGKRYVVNQSEGNYFLIQDKFWITHQREKDFHLYSLSDKAQLNEIKDLEAVKEEMSLRLKAVMQYFSQGMWDNKLYYPNGK